MKQYLITIFALIAFAGISLSAEGNKSTNIQVVGSIQTVENEDLKLSCESGAVYYVYTKEVIEKLKPYIGKKVKIDAQVITDRSLLFGGASRRGGIGGEG